MPKPIFVFAFSLLFGATAFSQQRKSVITVAPAMLAPGTYGVQAGFQFRINRNYSLISEAAVPVHTDVPVSLEKFTCFRLSSELKIYPKSRMEGIFLGLQLGLTDRKYSDLDSGQYSQTSHSVHATAYSSAKIHSPVIFFNAKLGKEVVHLGRFYMDYFLFVGIRFIATRFDGKDEYRFIWDRIEPTCRVSLVHIEPSWEENRNYVRPGAGFGLRFGWKL